jgi:hypothetical protein
MQTRTRLLGAIAVWCWIYTLAGHEPVRGEADCNVQAGACSSEGNAYQNCFEKSCDDACYYLDVVLQANGEECTGVVMGSDASDCEDVGGGCFYKECYCSSDIPPR